MRKIVLCLFLLGLLTACGITNNPSELPDSCNSIEQNIDKITEDNKENNSNEETNPADNSSSVKENESEISSPNNSIEENIVEKTEDEIENDSIEKTDTADNSSSVKENESETSTPDNNIEENAGLKIDNEKDYVYIDETIYTKDTPPFEVLGEDEIDKDAEKKDLLEWMAVRYTRISSRNWK